MFIIRLLHYDFQSPEATRELVTMLLVAVCFRFGTSEVPLHREHKCPHIAVRALWLGWFLLVFSIPLLLVFFVVASTSFYFCCFFKPSGIFASPLDFPILLIRDDPLVLVFYTLGFIITMTISLLSPFQICPDFHLYYHSIGVSPLPLLTRIIVILCLGTVLLFVQLYLF